MMVNDDIWLYVGGEDVLVGADEVDGGQEEGEDVDLVQVLAVPPLGVGQRGQGEQQHTYIVV